MSDMKSRLRFGLQAVPERRHNLRLICKFFFVSSSVRRLVLRLDSVAEGQPAAAHHAGPGHREVLKRKTFHEIVRVLHRVQALEAERVEAALRRAADRRVKRSKLRVVVENTVARKGISRRRQVHPAVASHGAGV